jgi:hypothetical protein
MKFSELVNWLKSLSDKITFKSEIKEMLEDLENDTRRVIDAKKGIVKVNWPVRSGSSNYETIEMSFDSHILVTTKNIINKPAINIVPEIKKADRLVEDIEIAINLASSDTYYEDFPNYLEALELTKEAILETVERLEFQKNKKGNPNWKGLSPAEKAKIISRANNLLSQSPKKYKPKKGSYVSEQLKTQVFDDLKQEMANVSRYKIARVLLENYQAKKSS